VKQGAILSPYLFCVYIDNLLLQLKGSGYGCHVGYNFMGALGYADDIILLSPTVIGMQNMLNICNTYANDHSIIFNAGKSNAIIFKPMEKANNEYQNNLFTMNGMNIPTVTNAKHLGHNIGNSFKGIVDTEYIVNAFNKSVNILLAEMGSVPSSILCKLFHSYCSSFYGMVLCRLKSSEVIKLCIAWRKACRRILRIPSYAHNNLLPGLMACKPLENAIENRIANFFVNMYTSTNVIVRSLAKRCYGQSVSNMGCNISYIGSKCKNYEYDESNIIDILRELIDIRDGLMHCDGCNSFDAKLMLDILTTT
jgi:hypothetical protein